MSVPIFSWQRDDFSVLQNVFHRSAKIILLHGKDFESPYHVLNIFLSELSDQEWMPLYLRPDPLRLSYPLLPFTQAAGQAVGETQKEHHILPNLIRDFTQSETIASIVGNIINERHKSVVLDSKENELMSVFEYATCGYSPIFVFQDYHLFDTHSQNFAGLLFSEQIDDDFPFLKEARYIFLCEGDVYDEIEQRISRIEHIDVQLTLPTANDAREIIREFAPQLTLSVAEEEKVFYLAGGRLSSMEILLRYLSANEQAIFDDTYSDAVQAVIADRLSKMGKTQNELESLLSLAANIGNTFSIPLLSRASGALDCERLLKKGDEEYFTRCDTTKGSFVFQEVWYYFYSHTNEDRRREIAIDLERAVYCFNPYDYLSRGRYFELAGQMQEACEMYLYAYQTMFMENIIPENGLTNHISALCEQCGLSSFWFAFRQVYHLFQSLKFDACADILEDMENPPTLRLLMLKEYLLGFCLHKLGGLGSQHEMALNVFLSLSQHSHSVEEGLWCDCQTILLSCYVNIGGHIDIAKEICRELTYYYTEKSFAPFAQKGLHALERKWSALYSVERAVVKSQHSVAYFRGSEYPAQYLMALNNHAANLIVLGRFSEAQESLDEAAIVLRQASSISVNRMYILSNYCLCAVLTKRITAQEACDVLRPIVEENSPGDWTFILQLNYAIYKALSGRLNEATQILCSLVQRAIATNDDYYEFYSYANLAAMYYLQGDRENAVQILKDKCLRAPSLCKPTEKQYMEDRTKQWISAMQLMEIKNPVDFDTYLLDRHPKETQWSFIGRGFLYSDIQFWTEP